MRKLYHHSSSESSVILFTFLQKSYENIPKSKPEELQYKLYQNLPQSFYKVTRVGFDLPKASKIKLGVYDVFGREICTLIDDVLLAGSYEVVFDASVFNLEPGILMYKLKTDGFVDTKKMILLNNNIPLT